MKTCLPDLPIDRTSPGDREEEIETICLLLQRPNVRLLTLIGPGGIGKTCLALQIAKNLLYTYRERYAFISLATATTADQVFSLLAHACGITIQAQQSALEAVITYLRDKPFLLLLDHFGQITGASLQIGRLLDTCSALKILVTSRVALQVQGAYEFSVPSLVLPAVTEGPEPPQEGTRHPLQTTNSVIHSNQPGQRAPKFPIELTRREVEVLRLLAEGLTDALIAERLVISRRTVNWYLTIIYSKIGVSCRSAATRYTLEHRLLASPT